MKPLFLIGLVVLILGFVSLVVPIPRSERHGLQAGDVSIGVTTFVRGKGIAHSECSDDFGRSRPDDRRKGKKLGSPIGELS